MAKAPETWNDYVDDPACHDAACSYRAEVGDPTACGEYQELLGKYLDAEDQLAMLRNHPEGVVTTRNVGYENRRGMEEDLWAMVARAQCQSTVPWSDQWEKFLKDCIWFARELSFG